MGSDDRRDDADGRGRARLLPYVTPPDEVCACPGEGPVLLRVSLGPNPIQCLRCNLEVPIDRLPLPDDLAEALAAWRDVRGALERLWLASGPYEAWAEAELADLDNEVNTRGRALRAELDAIRRCYYGCFRRDPEAPIDRCPVCAGPLGDAHPWARTCGPCGLAF